MKVRILSSRPRRDGLIKIQLTFTGGANGHGGSYPDKTFRKIVTPEKLNDYLKSADAQAKREAEYFDAHAKHPLDRPTWTRIEGGQS